MDLSRLFRRAPRARGTGAATGRNRGSGWQSSIREADELARAGHRSEAVERYLALADELVADDRFDQACRLARRAVHVDSSHVAAAERLSRWERVRGPEMRALLGSALAEV